MAQANLHCHSDNSFLDGLARVDEIARRTKEVGSEACALTDHNECAGHMAFQKAMRKEGLHPILGIEADWVYDMSYTRTLKYPTNRSHICLLAQNDKGLSNIWSLASLAYTDQYRYYKPLLTPDLMREYREGIYASSGCMITEFGRAIERGDEDNARQHFATLLDIFGDHFYAELHTWQFLDPDTAEKQRLNNLMCDINQAKVRFATEMGVPLVVVNDSHHAYPEQWENKELVWQFSTSKRAKGDDQDVQDYGQKADHLMGGNELYGWMAKHGIASTVVDEAIKNSEMIANACNAEIKRTLDMPRMAASEDDDLQMLLASVERGFKAKVTDEGLPEQIYYDRLKEELTLISQKRFAGYFNVVQNYVGAAVSGDWAPYAKAGESKAPMLCGPGRGSAGGCLVAYLLGITSLDPIHYDLLFDRFLAPGRKDLPDIDVDFPQSMRPGVKQYLEKRFKHDHVCTIGTLTRSQPKGILKDLGRAMKIDLADIVEISKVIEKVTAVEEGEDEPTWEEIVDKKGSELSGWAQKSLRHRQCLLKVQEMVGIVRQSGLHPSGVVVSNKPLLGTIPLRTRNNQVITQFDMYEVEELGAVKLDLLGLRHLDTLMYARNLIYKRDGFWLDFRDDRLRWTLRGGGGDPPNPGEDRVQTFGYREYADPAIWPQVAAGHTVGIFQIETPDLTRKGMELKPRDEKDVAVLISIVRPGVKDAGLDTAYLHRRAGVADVKYDHPMMEPITRDTYGVLIYQEQLLRTVKELAGFTADEADDLRKALGKKKMEKVVAFKEKFVNGCLSSREFTHPQNSKVLGETADRKAAERIWTSIEASGRYAFNKSHAVGYAVISTWELWTKHYYPLEFAVACMVTDGEDLTRYVRDARRLGIAILPPDVNRSDHKCAIEGDAIRYGIDSLRGIGPAGKGIQSHRPYYSLDDYLNRAGKAATNKSVVYNLIRIGAFDSIGDRTALLKELQYHRAGQTLAESTRADPEKLALRVGRRLADHPEQYTIEIPDFSDPSVIAAIEYELLGVHCTVDPPGLYREAIDAVITARTPSDMDGAPPRAEFIIGGMITQIKPMTIKKEGRYKGRQMAFMVIEHSGIQFDITVLTEVWDNCKLLLKEGLPVVCLVQKNSRGCNLKNVQRLDVLCGQK